MITYLLYCENRFKYLKKWFDSICHSCEKILSLKENIKFETNFVDAITIQKINKKYRKINKPTDVISFANRDNNNFKIFFIGEIYICPEIAMEKAKQNNKKLRSELILLFTHGLLHLLGYNHLKKSDYENMLNLERKIINQATKL